MRDKAQHFNLVDRHAQFVRKLRQVRELVEYSFTSDGQPDQEIHIEVYNDGDAAALTVHVRDAQGEMTQSRRQWGAPWDPHYVVQREGAKLVLRFGDGRWSRIPVGDILVTVGWR